MKFLCLKKTYFKAHTSVETWKCFFFGYTVLSIYCFKAILHQDFCHYGLGILKIYAPMGVQEDQIFIWGQELISPSEDTWSSYLYVALIPGSTLWLAGSFFYLTVLCIILFIILTFAKYQVGHYVTRLLGWTIQAYHLKSLLKKQIELHFWVPGTSLMKRETQGLDLTIGFTNTSFYHYMFSTSRLLRRL